ncbi:MAG: TIGR03943 family protein [Lachnospiraceae bacterium]|nr:TIGR03943 family protein [Lachnospiraceae bacterium]
MSMLKKKKEIPVYLFTGFLESGKTSFIKETLKDDQFKDGLTTVYIICEEGEIELSEKEIEENRFVLRNIDEEDEVTAENLAKIDLEVKPGRVLIEYNGTWDVEKMIEALPEHWLMAEGIATVDASTYTDYLNNMKQMMTRQFTYADLVLFNRCREDHDLPVFKRTVKAINRRAQVIFEMPDGTINGNVKEQLPYDMSAPSIEVADEEYGIWYLDVFENPEAYAGKTVTFKGQVYKPKKASADVFVPGRFAMTCCAADIQFVGCPCKWKDAKDLKEKSFVMVTAEIGSQYSRELGQNAPVLIAKSVTAADAPADEVVYFQ